MLDRDWCREPPFPRHFPKKNWGPWLILPKQFFEFFEEQQQ